MKKKRVITGGAGFVGTNLIKYLLKKTNYDLISIDNYSSGFLRNHVKSRRVKYIRGSTKNIGNILKCNLVTLSIPQVIRGEIGRGEREVQTALLEAQRLAPSVLFIDEFQAIFTARDGDSSSEGGSDVGQSLSTALATAFDTINRWNAHAGARNFILIIGATNEPWAVDKGFLRRGRFTLM